MAFSLFVEVRDAFLVDTIDDSTALENLMLRCRSLHADSGGYNATLEGSATSAASWVEWSNECDAGKAVSAVRVRYQDPYTQSDRSAIGDVIMYCDGK